jgi:very-short-patch-repair endonuclease
MGSILLLAIIGIICISLIRWYLAKEKTEKISEKIDDEIWPYKRKNLMTITEQKFFNLLHEALPEHQIFVQVALNQMLKVEKTDNWAKWYNKIAQMSVDFVISDNKGSIVAAIELDDKSHENEKNREKDAKKDKALKSANIEILRYRCEAMPSTNTIQRDIEKIYSKR